MQQDTAFVNPVWAGVLGKILSYVAGVIQLIVITVGALGIVLLDVVIGSFVLGKVGVHGASVDLWLFLIEVTPGFIALIISAALSAAKMISWDSVLAKKKDGGWAVGVMIAASVLGVLINVPFVGYYMHGVVPMGLINLDGSLLEYCLVLVMVLLTLFDAPMLVQLVNRLQSHSKTP